MYNTGLMNISEKIRRKGHSRVYVYYKREKKGGRYLHYGISALKDSRFFPSFPKQTNADGGISLSFNIAYLQQLIFSPKCKVVCEK